MHTSIGHQCYDQLTAVKTGYPLTNITCPYRRLRCWPIDVKYIFEVIRWQVTSFQMIAGTSLICFLNSYEICLVFVPHNQNFVKTDLGCENSASYYRQGRQLLLTFLAMFTRWSRSTSNFFALIGQNLTGELMRKIYAASWILFTLTVKLREFCVNLWCF